MKNIKALYINPPVYYCIAAIVLLFTGSFFFAFLYYFVWVLVALFLILFIADMLLLYGVKNAIIAQRIIPEKLSNGDDNYISIRLENNFPFKISVRIIDELPFQFQKRDFLVSKSLASKTADHFTYLIRPTKRGEYHFGNLNIYASGSLQLISRRYIFDNHQMVANYPSFLQMRKYELMAIHNKLFMQGLKKIRKIGNTREFEQIKEYTLGDDIRTINWKATAKKSQYMVNQYQDEKSQNIYMIIDKGRIMKSPFNDLTLLDYAINASLVLSNIIIKKYDKAGLFTFSKKVDNRLKPDNKPVQVQKFMESLYKVTTDFHESDFSKLYSEIKQNIHQRSLLILFTNFETLDGLNRQLKYLRAITKNHLLMVVFFKNSELDQLVHSKAKNTQEIYDKVIAEKFHYDKKLIVNELMKYGIYSVLTKPEDLNLNVINKYLEIKARGIL